MQRTGLKSRFFISLLVLLLLPWGNLSFAHDAVLAAANDQDINDIVKRIQEKHSELERLREQSDVFKKNVSAKQAESLNLLSQIAAIDNQIAKTDIDIEAANVEIEKTNLEIVNVQLQIQDKEHEIQDQKGRVANLIRKIHVEDQRSQLEILLLNNSFSEFFDQVQYLQQLQEDLQLAIDKLSETKNQLLAHNDELEAKNKELAGLRIKLEAYKDKLAQESSAKEILLAETRQSEQRFQSLLNSVRSEKASLDTELLELERSIRKRLAERQGDLQGLDAPSELIWPVPFQGITTYFHDPDYVFRRWVGEHSGLDLRTLISSRPANGVPVRAAASGTVIKVISNGKYTGNAVYLAHGGGLMTAYLHLSRFEVSEDEFVPVGKVIAMSGGLPGTFGAGLSTGPHLHFEVRSNGIPVNPLEYLPPPPIFTAGL